MLLQVSDELYLSRLVFLLHMQMAQGVPMDELDDMTLRKEYSPEALEETYYFSDYDHDDSIDWYFDPDHSVHSYLSDYHRLVLKNGDVSGIRSYS